MRYVSRAEEMSVSLDTSSLSIQPDFYSISFNPAAAPKYKEFNIFNNNGNYTKMANSIMSSVQGKKPSLLYGSFAQCKSRTDAQRDTALILTWCCQMAPRGRGMPPTRWARARRGLNLSPSRSRPIPSTTTS